MPTHVAVLADVTRRRKEANSSAAHFLNKCAALELEREGGGAHYPQCAKFSQRWETLEVGVCRCSLWEHLLLSMQRNPPATGVNKERSGVL